MVPQCHWHKRYYAKMQPKSKRFDLVRFCSSAVEFVNQDSLELCF